MDNNGVCWFSLCPVNGKVDIYPEFIAKRIEQAYSDGEEKCVLGSDFFNATILLNDIGNNNFFQTTLGLGGGYGRFGGKPRGLRSVKRVTLDSSKQIIVHAKKINYEWRIVTDTNDLLNDFNIVTLNETVPDINILSNTDNNQESLIEVWKSEDLENKDIVPNKNVIVWVWCKGIPEAQGNLNLLSDEWWCPYPVNTNREIENAFNQKNTFLTIKIPFDNSDRKIMFMKDNSYAKQVDTINNKSRLIKRIIISISKLHDIFTNQIKDPLNVTDLNQFIDDENVPHEFLCGISQQLMSDPVKTCDGFTYDRWCIQQWLTISNKSPMTGLELANNILTVNTTLREQIEQYINLVKNKYQNDIAEEYVMNIINSAIGTQSAMNTYLITNIN